jgi:hypothetical protein
LGNRGLIHVAYTCLRKFLYLLQIYFTPFRPSNSDFGYIEEGESTAGYAFTHSLCEIFCLPWHTHFGTSNYRFYISFKVTSKVHGPWWVLNPRCSDHESDTLTTKPRCPSKQAVWVSALRTPHLHYVWPSLWTMMRINISQVSQQNRICGWLLLAMYTLINGQYTDDNNKTQSNSILSNGLPPCHQRHYTMIFSGTPWKWFVNSLTYKVECDIISSILIVHNIKLPRLPSLWIINSDETMVL